jgi:prephenate dehydrogenase
MGLAHLVSLVLAATLEKNDVDLYDLDGLASTSFLNTVSLIVPILKQSPDLTWSIQRENPESLRIARDLADEVSRLRSALMDGSLADFARDVGRLRRGLRVSGKRR